MGRYDGTSCLMMDRRSDGQVKTHACNFAAYDDVVDVRKFAAVYRYGETSRGESEQRRTHAAGEFILRRACADDFAYRQRKQIAHAQRSCQRECARTAARHCVYIQRYPYANHWCKVLPTFEEPPAIGE